MINTFHFGEEMWDMVLSTNILQIKLILIGQASHGGYRELNMLLE